MVMDYTEECQYKEGRDIINIVGIMQLVSKLG